MLSGLEPRAGLVERLFGRYDRARSDRLMGALDEVTDPKNGNVSRNGTDRGTCPGEIGVVDYARPGRVRRRGSG